MPADDRMTIDERRKYLRRMAERYWRADRRGRSHLLTEMEAVVGLHRKSLLRLLHAPSLDRSPPSASGGGAPPTLWPGGSRRHPGGVGEPGLHLCGALDAAPAAHRPAPGALRGTAAHPGAGCPAGRYQPGHRPAAAAPLPPGHAPPAPAGPGARQSPHAARPHGAVALGNQGARVL